MKKFLILLWSLVLFLTWLAVKAAPFFFAHGSSSAFDVGVGLYLAAVAAWLGAIRLTHLVLSE